VFTYRVTSRVVDYSANIEAMRRQFDEARLGRST